MPSAFRQLLTHILFPYTTLFRSREGRVDDPVDIEPLPQKHAGADREEHRDRKSTRLNSSHRCISYAVFCLKKKIMRRISIAWPTQAPERIPGTSMWMVKAPGTPF